MKITYPGRRVVSSGDVVALDEVLVFEVGGACVCWMRMSSEREGASLVEVGPGQNGGDV